MIRNLVQRNNFFSKNIQNLHPNTIRNIYSIKATTSPHPHSPPHPRTERPGRILRHGLVLQPGHPGQDQRVSAQVRGPDPQGEGAGGDGAGGELWLLIIYYCIYHLFMIVLLFFSFIFNYSQNKFNDSYVLFAVIITLYTLYFFLIYS